LQPYLIELVFNRSGSCLSPQGRIADYLARLDFVILAELGDLPFARLVANISFISSAGCTSAPRSSSPQTSPSAIGRASLAIQK
jgi:hypothetical protein